MYGYHFGEFVFGYSAILMWMTSLYANAKKKKLTSHSVNTTKLVDLHFHSTGPYAKCFLFSNDFLCCRELTLVTH